MMSNLRLMVLVLIVTYIFAPPVFSWMLADHASWLRPFVVWTLVIVGLVIIQKPWKHDEF